MAIPTLVRVVPNLAEFSPVIRYAQAGVSTNNDARWFDPRSGFVLVQPDGAGRNCWYVGAMNRSRIGGLYPLTDLHAGTVEVTGDGALRYVVESNADGAFRMGPFRMIEPERDSQAIAALRSANFMVKPTDSKF